MEMWLSAWWTYCLLALGLFFTLLMMSCTMSRHYLRVEEKYIQSIDRSIARNDLNPNYLESNTLEPTYLESNDLYALVIRIRGKHALWSTLATRTYTIIMLFSAAVGLASQFLASPFWIGYLLMACGFCAAFFLYKTWRKEEEM